MRLAPNHATIHIKPYSVTANVWPIVIVVGDKEFHKPMPASHTFSKALNRFVNEQLKKHCNAKLTRVLLVRPSTFVMTVEAQIEELPETPNQPAGDTPCP